MNSKQILLLTVLKESLSLIILLKNHEEAT
jgi:hypothetical protein